MYGEPCVFVLCRLSILLFIKRLCHIHTSGQYLNQALKKVFINNFLFESHI